MVLHACVCRLYAPSNSVLFVARMETLIPMSVPWTQPRVKEVRLLLCRVKESASRPTKVSPARFSFSFVFCYCEEDLFVYKMNLHAEHIFLWWLCTKTRFNKEAKANYKICLLSSFISLCMSIILPRNPLATQLPSICWLRNRKHVLCLCQVIETRVEVWENEKCEEHEPQLSWVLPNFHECFY